MRMNSFNLKLTGIQHMHAMSTVSEGLDWCMYAQSKAQQHTPHDFAHARGTLNSSCSCLSGLGGDGKTRTSRIQEEVAILQSYPGDSRIIPFLIMTCFLIRDYNMLSRKELHRSLQIPRPSTAPMILEYERQVQGNGFVPPNRKT